jgi:polyphosphate kinase
MNSFFDRDLSWLSFNGRVLQEASKENLPLMERFRFLSIYSSNLDEFYRVRVPALRALQTLGHEKDDLLNRVTQTVTAQQNEFGRLFEQAREALKAQSVFLLYNEPFPETIRNEANRYFLDVVSGYLQIAEIDSRDFFCENNKIYLLVTAIDDAQKEKLFLISVPSDRLPRFYTINDGQTKYITFLDDIIENNLPYLLEEQVKSAHTFKITRNAELDIEDEFQGNLAKKIEKKLAKRDYGLATRVLYEPGLPTDHFKKILNNLNLDTAMLMQGGHYHNLKDLASLPIKGDHLSYPPWPSIKSEGIIGDQLLLETLVERDILIHPPYHAYDTIIRFFNEASIDPHVTEIFITLYRIAEDSRIVTALINAAKNGKKVTVFIELKARFDEENNLRWSRKMKQAGVRLIYSIPGLKVHAKIALVKAKYPDHKQVYGLLSTGNFNENTGRFYTDHILLTARKELLDEMLNVFRFLKKPQKKTRKEIKFEHLLVAQFNLLESFIKLIDAEITAAKSGQEARIKIKLNNMEEEVLINKLYEASQAGVKIDLIVRSICRLIPGITGISENIRVIRIVDRYLEHGRIFYFHNLGDHKVFLGSADWMNRNIYRRVEVCFPVLDSSLKWELIHLLDIQLSDTVQAVQVNKSLANEPVPSPLTKEPVRSQEAIRATLNKNKLIHPEDDQGVVNFPIHKMEHDI